MRFRTLALCAVVAGLVGIAGCGDGEGPGEDGGVPSGDAGDGGGARDAGDGGVAMRCGNGEIEGTEECDDGNTDADDGCSPSCEAECGDGAVSGDELCDTGIAAGEAGACPTECDDGEACTTDTLDGTACSVECAHGPIESPADGDGCCPSGATATTDDDCPGACGDGLVTGTEVCDTTIPAGTVGACPTACDDLDGCTTDTLQMAGTCDATCTHDPITTPSDGDMCCPAGATIGTDDDCAVACGDAVLSAGETCDTGIAAGSAGACPTSCPDVAACAVEALTGAGTCGAQCTSTAITAPIDGDGCCPAGATMATDDDCTATCGNGVVESGEACDTGIGAGMPGRCPTTCSDGMACTSDVLTGAGTCAATCSHPPVTAPANGDGCCPSGATVGNDSDCPIACGDGIVSSGESCDTGIAAGAGSCPSACSDGVACTSDILVGTACTAMCTHPAITSPVNGDGCCPTGATIGNDNDCAARCGDGVTTAPETCDDGGTAPGDGCSATCTAEAAMPTAYRLSDLDIRDPHVFASVFGCNDITNTVFGMDGLNPLLQDNIQADGDGDGLLDLSITHVFTPLLQTAGTSTPSYLAFPDCTAPMSSTSCTLPAGEARLMGTAMNMGGASVCLEALMGTTRASYTPATVYPTAGGGGTCYVASAGTVTFNLGGIPITLTDAYIGGEWFGSPATEIRDGLIRGFISEAVANRTYIPDGTTGFGSIDCQPLGSLLPGGNPPALTAADPGPPPPCTRPTNPPANCSGNDDRDTGPGGERGWYFYLNFRAARVSSYTAL